MSGLARTSVLRGTSMMHSSGPQLASAGRWLAASAVIFRPIRAKLPDSNSKMSGQPYAPGVCAPSACGFGPSRLRIMPNYYYSNLHCQASSLVILRCGKRPNAECGCFSRGPNLAAGTREARVVHDSACAAGGAVAGNDQLCGAGNSESEPGHVAPNRRSS